MAHTTVVSTADLAAHLGEWRIFDCRHDLMKPELGEQQYRQAHIPGALFASLDRDLSAPKSGKNGRHPLPEPEVFGQWLGRQGLKPGDQVVCYDASNGAMAARLWWMLRWVGHEAVAVLDGGLAKWTSEGRPVSSDVPAFAATDYPVNLNEEVAVGARMVHRRLGQQLLVDARAPARWRGEQEPIDSVAGRIPGALNRFNMDNVGPDGTFKPAEALRKDFQDVLAGRAPRDVVNYCGSGVAACHNLLAMEIAGLPGAKLFAGSWSEWIADPARPQERG
ncbi:MAG TPA: sulfurtransferase [Burkholderiales bacterium]|nr:sulfurtransferase [Burkholderiales bacterium]